MRPAAGAKPKKSNHQPIPSMRPNHPSNISLVGFGMKHPALADSAARAVDAGRIRSTSVHLRTGSAQFDENALFIAAGEQTLADTKSTLANLGYQFAPADQPQKESTGIQPEARGPIMEVGERRRREVRG